MNKTCTCCQVEKDVACFYKKKDSKDGFASACIECRKQKKAMEYQRDRERVLSRVAQYRLSNPDKVSAAKARCYQNKKPEYQAKQRQYYSENKDRILAVCKDYRTANAQDVKERQANYRSQNRKKLTDAQKVYYAANRVQRLAYSASYQRERARIDPIYAISRLVRRRISLAIAQRGYSKTSRTSQMLGCSFAHLKKHIERQFLEGMSWANRGAWHIDHIIPLASASDEQELLQLCHYKNLQPLWALDNLSKGAKMPTLIAAVV